MTKEPDKRNRKRKSSSTNGVGKTDWSNANY